MPDHLGSLVIAVCLFPLIIWVPGMVLGYTTGALGFRLHRPEVQISLGLLFSIASGPILIYLLVRAGGFRLVWSVYGAIWLVAAIIAVREHQSVAAKIRDLARRQKLGVALVLVWIVFCGLWEVDFVTSTQVFRDLNTMDAIAHIAFTDAISRTGIPPSNPFVYPGHPLTLFYYYAWYLLCSVVDQLGGTLVTPRAAVQAGTIYVGLGAAALVVAYGSIMGSKAFGGLRKLRSGIALALFAITGLDLIPWTFLYILKRFLHQGPGAGPSIERWNEQVTAWIGAVLMSPHHPAAMIACFTAVLLFTALIEPGGKLAMRVVLTGLTAIALASTAAMSAYIILAFAFGMALWVVLAVRRGWWRPIVMLCIAAILAGAMYAPFALELRRASHETQLPLALTVRAFIPVDYWLPSIFRFLKTSPASVYLLRFILLPVNYFGELGFFLVSTILYWRWRRSAGQDLKPEESILAALAAGSILVCTFLTSTLRWNDLGWRGFLVAQFVMLLWAAPVMEALLNRAQDTRILPSKWRPLIWFCLVIGVAGTLTEIVNMRVNFDGLGGPQAVADRAAYMWIDEHSPKDTVLLFNPDVYLEYFNSLYAYRQTVSAGQAYGAFFSSGEEGRQTFENAVRFFEADRSPAEIASMRQRYRVGTILVSATDPVWKDGTSWVWRYRPSFANSLTRVFTGTDIP